MQELCMSLKYLQIANIELILPLVFGNFSDDLMYLQTFVILLHFTADLRVLVC